MRIFLIFNLFLISGLLLSAPLKTEKNDFNLNQTKQCKNLSLAKVVQPNQLKVTCCCRVSGGGQCCGEVSVCTGGFVPGCYCSNYNQDSMDSDFFTKK
jgi:hypothetical protein